MGPQNKEDGETKEAFENVGVGPFSPSETGSCFEQRRGVGQRGRLSAIDWGLYLAKAYFLSWEECEIKVSVIRRITERDLMLRVPTFQWPVQTATVRMCSSHSCQWSVHEEHRLIFFFSWFQVLIISSRIHIRFMQSCCWKFWTEKAFKALPGEGK